MQNFETFTKELIGKTELYDNYNTFYIRMKNADYKTKETYNRIKNALASYRSRVNKDESVVSELGPRSESFSIGDTLIARFVISGGQLHIHLSVDPETQSTREAMYKVMDGQMIAYKLEKANSVEQVIKTIPKMMSTFNFVSLVDYKEEDYASFFNKPISEIEPTVSASQKEYDEKVAASKESGDTSYEDGTEAEDADYGDAYDNENGAVTRKLKHDFLAAPTGTPSDDELLQVINKKKRKPVERIKKIKVWKELADYGYEFVWLRYVEFYLAAIIVAVGLGLAYQLKPLWMIILAVAFSLMMPQIVAAYYKNKYEEKRYDDVTTYIEQMLYSFRKNSKIIVSLRDALSVFPVGGHMYDTIMAALHSTQTSTSGSTIYSDALGVIEKEYPCRRIRSLHRYMIKVEGVGGDHDSGIEALLKDRRLWIERLDAFKQECKTVLTDIYISIGFSIALACMVVRMMATDLVDIPSNLFYQISSVVFLVVCGLTIMFAMKNTTLDLEDEEDEASSKRTIDKINWLRNYDSRKELKKSVRMSVIFVLFLAVGIFLKNVPIIIFALVALCYSVLLKRFMDKNAATKSACRAIEKAYPDWLLELALLLQIDNLHVAIEKTIDDAPLIIRGDLVKLDEEIIKDPTSLTPFVEFFDFLPLTQIHSSMKLLYSISEFGQAKGSVQLMELVERNSALMDKAEKYRNDDRLSSTFILKFIPMGISAIKLLCDLAVLLISYLSIITTAM